MVPWNLARFCSQDFSLMEVNESYELTVFGQCPGFNIETLCLLYSFIFLINDLFSYNFMCEIYEGPCGKIFWDTLLEALAVLAFEETCRY